MRRVVFVIALIAGIASGLSGLSAQTIEGDSNWPSTTIIDEPPPAKPQQARPRPAQSGSEQSAAPSAAAQPQAPSSQQPGQAATSSARPARSPSAQQQPRAAERESEPRTRRQPASEPGNDETATLSPPVPPVPLRREATAPAAIVPVVAPQLLPPVAQTAPVAPQLLPVAAPTVPVTPRQPAPLALNLIQTPPAPPPDDGLGKLIGQMLIVGFQGAAPDESWPRQVTAQIESGKIGGVLVMSHNILAPDQLSKLTAAFRRTKAQIAPFIAVDQGGGLVQRLPAERGFQRYASAAELGMSNDPLNAFNLYQRMAMELIVHGFNVNFGPVVDLEQSGANGAAPVHERRYGSQPKHVAAFAKAFRMAHHGEGLLTVLKHFPGPAGVRDEAGSGTGSAPRWDAAALEPYRQLVAGGNADMVMVGHLVHPEFSDEPGLPASLSAKTIQTRLREEIGFKGVVISDDLEARAVATRFPLEVSVVRAIKAGNDLLLIGNQDKPSLDLPERVADIIRQAVTTGALTRERLQASYDRIVAAKQSVSKAAREIASAKQTEADEEKPTAP